jgi:ABC-type sugar transport system ATPase subunit
MATIRLEDVTKTYARPQSTFGDAGPARALDQVTLTIPNGQTVALVGPSGCGKSTLLRVVAGLEDDYTGHVYFDGRDMRDVPPRDRNLGMVFQNYALYPHFEGKGNLSFFFRLRNAPDAETEERIRITSDIMGIGFRQLLARKPGTLSGGQQQRLAIGRAIVRNPSLFLLDEPLSNLDAKLRTQTRIEIKRLLRRFRITTMYVTHDQVEASALGDLIAVMRAGRIEQVGPLPSLLRDPQSAFVAGFLGTPPMNLFHGCVEEGQLRLDALTMPLPDSIEQRVHHGQRIIVGVRPESGQLIIDDSAPANGLRLRGEVEVVEPDLARQTQLVYLRSGPHAYAVAIHLVKEIAPRDQLDVFFPHSDLYFFDGVSERRLS